MTDRNLSNDQCAFPVLDDSGSGLHCREFGLTKRELFAAIAMQGLLSGAYSAIAGLSKINGMAAVKVAAQTAVEHADELLAALEHTNAK